MVSEFISSTFTKLGPLFGAHIGTSLFWGGAHLQVHGPWPFGRTVMARRSYVQVMSLPSLQLCAEEPHLGRRWVEVSVGRSVGRSVGCDERGRWTGRGEDVDINVTYIVGEGSSVSLFVRENIFVIMCFEVMYLFCSPNSLLLGFYLRKKELATLTGRAPELCGWSLWPGLLERSVAEQIAMSMPTKIH